jgi:tetratricopeptide (TPR) repeat protein
MLIRAVLRPWAAFRTRQLFFHGRYEEAIELCRRLLRRCPQDPPLLYLLGRAHFGQKSYAGAYFCLSSALHRAEGRQRPLPAALHYFRGVSAYHLGRLAACVESLERFRAEIGRVERHLTPSVSLAKACVFLGYARLKQGQVALAAEMFEEVLRCRGAEETSVVVDLAAIYCSEPMGRPRDAVRILQDALGRFPQEVELLKGLSYAHGLLEEHEPALRYALESLRRCPEDSWTHRQLAYLYARRDAGEPGVRRRARLRLVQRLDEPA